MNRLRKPDLGESSHALIRRTFGVGNYEAGRNGNLYIPNPRVSRYAALLGNVSITDFRFPQPLPVKLAPTIRAVTGREETEFERYLRERSQATRASITIESIQANLIDGKGNVIDPEDWEESARPSTSHGEQGVDPKLAFTIAGTAMLPELDLATLITVDRMALHPATMAQQGEPYLFNQATLTPFV